MLTKWVVISCLLAVIPLNINAQEKDSIPYDSYKHKLVLYTDFGYSTAPMSIYYPFPNNIKRLVFRNNFKPVIGLGFAYKWMALRFNISIPSNVRSVKKYGKTNFIDLNLDFTFKKVFFNLNWHLYQGFAIKDAYQWNDTITEKDKNLIRQDINSFSAGLNVFQFWNDHFVMNAFKGKTASYQEDVHTFYLKYFLNLHGISSSKPLIPIELQDTSDSKTTAIGIGAFDLGVIPGYAYVRRWKIFQLGIMGGVGLTLQSKYYTFNNQTRSFLGLAPRSDFRISLGINKPKYFLMLTGDIDTKFTRLNKLKYWQTFYNSKIVLGFRINVKKNEKT